MDKKEKSGCTQEPKNLQNASLVQPPDGGWGWAVVLGSFFCNAIVDGIIFSYGLLLPELSKDLGVSKGRLAWVGSLLAGFYLIAGNFFAKDEDMCMHIYTFECTVYFRIFFF